MSKNTGKSNTGKSKAGKSKAGKSKAAKSKGARSKGARSKGARSRPGRPSQGKSKPGKPERSPWDAALSPRAAGEQRHWLVKSEPETFSFDDLLRIHNKTTHWNGIRNFVARNFLRDGMKLGDRVFFYHSGAAPGIVGICEVMREGYPDDTAFDAADPGYDPKSTKEKPVWFMVDLRAVAQFTRPVTLAEIRTRKELKNMAMLRIGRLSVTPVTAAEWRAITELAER
jgi:predicted RNA-binding protein with PUA-like domain